MTLEWLLIVVAISGLGAASVLVVQRVLDTTTDESSGPEVIFIEADIAAAQLTAEFEATGSPALRAEFEQRCLDLAAQFSDVVDTAEWRRESAPSSVDDPTTPENETVSYPERCIVQPH